MSREKGSKEYLSTDGTNLGVKVNVKTKFFNYGTEVTDIIKMLSDVRNKIQLNSVITLLI